MPYFMESGLSEKEAPSLENQEQKELIKGLVSLIGHGIISSLQVNEETLVINNYTSGLVCYNA